MKSKSRCWWCGEDPLYREYHDKEWGVPVHDDRKMFEMLTLEGFQAGLSWITILRKRDNFRKAFKNFNVRKVARFGKADVARLMRDEGIIRNRLKVDAAIENARRLVQIRASHGSFAAWLDDHHPLAKPEWVKLFKKSFAFTGGEITGEFLLSTGYLPGAHDPSCPVYATVARLRPPWMRAQHKKGQRTA